MSDFHFALMGYVQTGDIQDVTEHLDDGQNKLRLAVYRNTFISSCIDALQRKYPSAEKLLGEDFFKTLTRQFCLTNPPTSPVLAEYGEIFPEYLNDFLQHNHPELRYLWDICKLDRAWHHAYFADDKPSLGQDEIESLIEDIESKSLSLHPSVQLIKNDWSVSSLWAQLRVSNLSEQVAIENTTENLLLWRDNSSILHRVISESESLFISSIYAGRTLGQAADVAMQNGEIDISEIFSQLLLNKLLT
ncbi:DNA-binding domain-containing protein [Aliiglaciecola sp. 2_MG-2023]|uniref:HvfC/BufC N-terminal domain-containing protein n=1 Tax=unclassified Aliiglaciecola TaxID=2593648 RepID=UPI0026E2C6C0|nr:MULTISPECIES: DNA-binding domain-containing protein [unclassified Aliiglaciecola]MDO6712549.1 DNA-binding domain-containing protein [Aliiglaciecola sp. 2_MG-2023]MDO6753707.1 DNA-binding domain-containing protein [Aliiglaciecola sp. 1_MG-2023]